RSYLAISDPSQLADLDAIAEPVSLIVLRWPRRPTRPNPANVTDLFAGCRLMMTADSCAVVTIASVDPVYMRDLLPAAQAVGLVHVREIVAVRGSGEGDQFLYYASRAEADAVRNEIRGDQRNPASHIDLLVFSAERPRHE